MFQQAKNYFVEFKSALHENYHTRLSVGGGISSNKIDNWVYCILLLNVAKLSYIGCVDENRVPVALDGVTQC